MNYLWYCTVCHGSITFWMCPDYMKIIWFSFDEQIIYCIDTRVMNGIKILHISGSSHSLALMLSNASCNSLLSWNVFFKIGLSYFYFNLSTAPQLIRQVSHMFDYPKPQEQQWPVVCHNIIWATKQWTVQLQSICDCPRISCCVFSGACIPL